MRQGLFALLVCFVVVGCSRPASQDTSYDSDCAVDTDCAVVAYASCALCGSCGDLAINVDELDRFDDDNQVTCPPREAVPCGACQETVAACVDGGCVMQVCDDDGACAAP